MVGTQECETAAVKLQNCSRQPDLYLEVWDVLCAILTRTTRVPQNAHLHQELTGAQSREIIFWASEEMGSVGISPIRSKNASLSGAESLSVGKVLGNFWQPESRVTSRIGPKGFPVTRWSLDMSVIFECPFWLLPAGRKKSICLRKLGGRHVCP